MTITAPADGSTVPDGASVTFTGSASDTEDGDLSASLSWSSSLDGAIGSGSSFSTSTLSVGSHLVTATATDSGGLTGLATVGITVDPAGGPTIVTFKSQAPEDGWVRESSETSNVGSTVRATKSGTSALRVGDNRKDRQYKAFVSFDTSAIPDGATILSATLRLRRGKVVGTSPFTTHGACLVDASSGGFSGDPALESSDFEATASASTVSTLSNPAANGDWAEGVLDSGGVVAIDATGTTQFRVYFALDDNDDSGNDYVGFYSGEDGDAANQPELEVTYQ